MKPGLNILAELFCLNIKGMKPDAWAKCDVSHNKGMSLQARAHAYSTSYTDFAKFSIRGEKQN